MKYFFILFHILAGYLDDEEATAGVLYDLADGGWVGRGGGSSEPGNDTRLPNAPDRLTPPPPGNRLVEEEGVRRGSDSSDDGGGGGTDKSSS